MGDVCTDKRIEDLWEIMRLLYDIRGRTPTSDLEGWNKISDMQSQLHNVINHYNQQYLEDTNDD